MTTRAQIVEEARTWIGTPFHHQGRLKGVAADCIGASVCPAHACGIDVPIDIVDYPRQPTPDRTLAMLERYMDRIPVETARMADLLFIWFAKFANGGGAITTEPTHFVLLTEHGRAIHAHATIGREKRGIKRHAVKAGRVVEATIPVDWLAQIHSAWRFRGLEDG